MVKTMGGEFKRILLVGCEPATLGPENEGQLGLSAPVEAAIDEAVCVIESLVTDILKRDHEDVML
jgi:hydrogenase maturation protease